MTPTRSTSLAVVIASIMAAAQAHAQSGTTVVYGLARDSDFEWGCFAPCACPVLVRQPVLGTFKLTKVASDPLFDYYDVTDVRWELPDNTSPVPIVGTGRYRRGGEVALQEQLTLFLMVGQGQTQRFDSGLVPPQAPFPEIRTTISIHGVYCFDSVFTVVAKPLEPASVDASRAADILTATPSPFRDATEVEYSLARDGRIELGVFDLTGRRVRSLSHGEWLAAGRHRRTWDGRLSSGSPAPPGLYFIRLATGEGLRRRPVVRLR